MDSAREEPAPAAGRSSSVARRAAFDRLTQSRLDRAYRLAGSILETDADAQDAVHDAAVQAWTRWESLRDEARFDAWFDRIVVNVCKDRRRRMATARRSSERLDVQAAADPADRVSQIDSLRRAVSVLTLDHKIVVVLRFLEDLSVEEIAARTGERSGTVKSRLHYALRELHAAYDAAQRPGGFER